MTRGKRTLAIALCGIGAAAAAGAVWAAPAFRLTSSAFASGKPIPVRFSCRGDNVSPPLRWTSPPKGTRSFALELEDPDAPGANGFTHWLAWGFSASARGLVAGKHAPIEGRNGTGATGYVGPCPPTGVHHYRFTLYALDATPRLRSGASRGAFLRALNGHVLKRAGLVGTFGS